MEVTGLLTVLNMLVLGLNLVVFGLSLKLYTEYLKDKSMDRRQRAKESPSG